MRHRIKKFKLGRTDSHRKSLMRNMLISFVKNNGSMITSVAKAKCFKQYAEKLISCTKRMNCMRNKHGGSDFFIYRSLLPKIGCANIIKKIIALVADYQDRSGGYMRIVKCGYRNNDKMALAMIQLVRD